jgi:hypothetical protein
MSDAAVDMPASPVRPFDDRVRERDLDHFLIEELQADPCLLRLFLERVAHAFRPPADAAPVVGKARRLDGRETDLRVAYGNHADDPPSLLVENKVGDGFQDGQPESYAAEVARLRAVHGPLGAAAILVAPRSNTAVAGNACFDGHVDVEEIAEHVRGRLADDAVVGELRARLAVRVELLDALCGKRTNSRWTAAPVEAVAEFAVLYENLARQVLPGLRVRPTTGGANARTRFFDGFPWQKGFFPMPVQLKHELGDGVGDKYANLEFAGAAERLSAFLAAEGLFPQELSITATKGGRSLMIRMRTPAVVRDPDWFAGQRDQVARGLQAVGQLATWLDVHHAQVRALLME